MLGLQSVFLMSITIGLIILQAAYGFPNCVFLSNFISETLCLASAEIEM
jgi:hypothetical protein